MIKTNNIPYIAVEINEIFKNLSIEIYNKIPNDVITFFKNEASDDYVFIYDKNKDLLNQNIRQDTKEMLSIIYKDYICENKDEFIKKRKVIDYNKELKKKEKYNPENLFKNKAENIVSQSEEIKTLTLIDKITRFLKKIFKF